AAATDPAVEARAPDLQAWTVLKVRRRATKPGGRMPTYVRLHGQPVQPARRSAANMVRPILQRRLGNQVMRLLLHAQRQPERVADAGHATPVLQRQPAPKPVWKQVWPEFQAAKASDPAAATTLAEQLASARKDDDDLRQQGLEVVAWLQGH